MCVLCVCCVREIRVVDLAEIKKKIHTKLRGERESEIWMIALMKRDRS